MVPQQKFFVPSAAGDNAAAPTGANLYARFAIAGAVCCSITHGAMTPVDVVKTRIQLSPEVYNKGMISGFRQVIAAEGAGALLTGFGPTAAGKCLHSITGEKRGIAKGNNTEVGRSYNILSLVSFNQ